MLEQNGFWGLIYGTFPVLLVLIRSFLAEACQDFKALSLGSFQTQPSLES